MLLEKQNVMPRLCHINNMKYSIIYLLYIIKASWNGVVEKSIRVLTNWKMMDLSKGSRIAFIKSTLSKFPTYLLSILPIPMAVAKYIESIQCGFLWGGIGEEFKSHLVNWLKVCSPVQEGELGICNLKCFNHALLGKWLLRYASKPGACWRRMVEAKYGSKKGGWRSCIRAGPHGMGFWKSISKDWHRFSSHFRLIPGDESRISFWGEVWCGSSPLKEVFPGLYSLASNNEAFIVDNYDLLSRSHQWNVSFLRSLNDWEVEDLASLYSFLYSYKLGGEADKIWWILNKKGKFEVSSFYNILILNVSTPFP
jgi:hypothetical protein